MWLGSCFGKSAMIVSALVVTCRESTESLRKWLEEDRRVEVGALERGFIPIVTTTESLTQAKNLHDELRLDPAVIDVQLVSWVDDEAVSFDDVCASSGTTKEQQ